MSKNPIDAAADRSRRLFGAAGAAGAALAMASVCASAARPAVKGPPFKPTRARFALPANTAIPKSSNSVYVTPFGGAALFNDGDVTMNNDYTITVNTTGLYLVALAFEWQDAANGQAGLRINGISHSTPANPPGQFVPGKLTIVQGKNDRLGQFDTSSTNSAKTSRYQGLWKPGTIGKNAVASIDVTVATRGVVKLGDVAMASHSAITDALGDGAAALIVTAKVVAADTVRVSIYNSSHVKSITVPKGALQVVAMTAVSQTGDAPAGRSLLLSATETLNAGDILYGTFKSTVAGDTLLNTPNTFIQIERWG